MEKVFVVLIKDTYDFETSVYCELFSNKKDAQKRIKEIIKYKKRDFGCLGKTDEEFLDHLEMNYNYYGTIDDDNIEIYFDGYAAKESFYVWIEESQINKQYYESNL